jgi:ferredoxin
VNNNTESLYEKLAELFGKIGYAAEKGPELDALLRALFSKEEARIALNLSPLAPEPAEDVAARMDADPSETARMLEVMTDKGLIYCSERESGKRYKTIQLVPGIFELQFMRGQTDERARVLARLFDAYFHVREAGGPKKKPEMTPFARVIPVEETVQTGIQVHPYEEVSRYIEEADAISVSTCYCRHKQRLLGGGCEHPDDVCLSFGSFARFVINRGFGRAVNREEALDILRRSEESGLVHTTTNTRDQVDFLCNCCGCCCGVIQSVTSSTMPSMTATSNYFAWIDKDACIGCEECVDICAMAAITMEDEMARIDLDRCIGCGLCVTACESGALFLRERPKRQEPCASFKDLTKKQVEDKMRAST